MRYTAVPSNLAFSDCQIQLLQSLIKIIHQIQQLDQERMATLKELEGLKQTLTQQLLKTL